MTRQRAVLRETNLCYICALTFYQPTTKQRTSMKTLIALLAAFLLNAASAFAKDIKTLVVTPAPQMHCASCEKKIKDGLRFERGVKDIATSLEKQTVTVKYDADKTTEEKLLNCFTKIGYKATVVKDGCTEKACGADKKCCAEKKSCCGEAGEKQCCGKSAQPACAKKACGKDNCEKADTCKKACGAKACGSK